MRRRPTRIRRSGKRYEQMIFVISLATDFSAGRAKHGHLPTGRRMLRQGPPGKERLVVRMSEYRKNPMRHGVHAYRFSLFPISRFEQNEADGYYSSDAL